MKGKQTLLALFVLFLFHITDPALFACSTFKLQKGDALIYGHNLNEGDMGVPGLVFINKRGIFKTGRSWSELTTPNHLNPSDHCWISRYGSVTFNNFGKDFPDGGMNEAGLFIWEMNEDADYPQNDNLPKLNQMNWMQYILDNFSTMDEAILCASEIEIDGWGWHFFVGDAQGNTAAIAFVDGKVIVDSDDQMPVPALFNTPYKRELELLKYYKGFGGNYEPDVTNPKVPRFVRTAVLIDEFQTDQNPVDYGFYMLKTLRVYDDPEWSVLFDVREKMVYFRTRLNPEIKQLSLDDIDFTNRESALVLDIDQAEGGNVLSSFQNFTTQIMRDFTVNKMFPLFPQEFFTRGGITIEEYLERISTHSDLAMQPDRQFFVGIWENVTDTAKQETTISVNMEAKNDAVLAFVSNGKETYPTDHLHLIGNKLQFTFITKGGSLLEITGVFQNDRLKINLNGIEDFYGSYILQLKD